MEEKTIKYQETVIQENKSKFMFFGRYCEECKNYIKGFQKIPIAYNCIHRWGFRCPICNKANLIFLPKNKKLKK